MTGTICINDDHEIDLSQPELASVAASLRRNSEAADAAVMREVFWPMDEAGMTFLLADELDTGEFAVFAGVVHRAYDQTLRSEAGSLALWERLLVAVRDDPRFGALPRR